MSITSDNSSPIVDRSVLDRHAVKAVGDLLMLAFRLERRGRTARKGLTAFRKSNAVSRS